MTSAAFLPWRGHRRRILREHRVSLNTLDRIAAFARSEPTVLLPAHDPLAKQRLAERITLTDD
jgi:hypothetical protein